MNAIVDRGMVTPTAAAVIRGTTALNDVRELLDQLATVDAHKSTFSVGTDVAADAVRLATNIGITFDEVLEVIARRRQAITNKLENKGIRIAPDPELLTTAQTEDVIA